MSFTSEQIDKIMAFAEQNFSEDALSFPLDIDALQKNFNAEMQTFLDKCPFEDAETAEVMENLFLIKNFCEVFDLEKGKFFFNVFGDRTAIFGVSDSDNYFKLLTCVYTAPDTAEENTLSSMILAYFVKILLPEVDPEQFLRELSASIIKTKGGTKFSIAAEGDLIFVTATRRS